MCVLVFSPFVFFLGGGNRFTDYEETPREVMEDLTLAPGKKMEEEEALELSMLLQSIRVTIAENNNVIIMIMIIIMIVIVILVIIAPKSKQKTKMNRWDWSILG